MSFLVTEDAAKRLRPGSVATKPKLRLFEKSKAASQSRVRLSQTGSLELNHELICAAEHEFLTGLYFCADGSTSVLGGLAGRQPSEPAGRDGTLLDLGRHA